MRNLESKLQSECVKWFRYQFPKLAGRLIAIPNGGHRNKITAIILKREGVLAGVSDLFLAVPGRARVTCGGEIKNVGGVWIEMKFNKGKLSTAQEKFRDDVMGDYLYLCINSFDSFKKLITEYLT